MPVVRRVAHIRHCDTNAGGCSLPAIVDGCLGGVVCGPCGADGGVAPRARPLDGGTLLVPAQVARVFRHLVCGNSHRWRAGEFAQKRNGMVCAQPVASGEHGEHMSGPNAACGELCAPCCCGVLCAARWLVLHIAHTYVCSRRGGIRVVPSRGRGAIAVPLGSANNVCVTCACLRCRRRLRASCAMPLAHVSCPCQRG